MEKKILILASILNKFRLITLTMFQQFLQIMIKNILTYLLKLFSVCMICRAYFAQSDENIALHKPAFQSSTWLFGKDANEAVDGNYNQNVEYCAHGSKEVNILNWLEVDLVDLYYISLVIFTPRNTSGKVFEFDKI